MKMVKNMKNTKIGTYFHNDESYSFNFGTDLSIADKARFVNSVVGLVVDDINYNSVIKDLIFDFYTIEFFTNIDTTELKQSPNFLDDVEQFLEETNVVDIVRANMEVGLLDELNKAVDKSIEYRTGIHPSPIADSLASLINTLEKKVNEVDLDNAMGMVQKFAEMTGELTPESVVNAYINSDMHKKNVEEIAEGKKDNKNKKSKKSKKNEIKIDENLGEAIRTVVEENKAENAEVVE